MACRADWYTLPLRRASRGRKESASYTLQFNLPVEPEECLLKILIVVFGSVNTQGPGKARILTKIAHSIGKPLLKRLHEAGKNERNGNKRCMNYTKYTLERLLLGLKRSKLGKWWEKKFAMSYFRQDPSLISWSCASLVTCCMIRAYTQLGK